jgi:hypothetical protein
MNERAELEKEKRRKKFKNDAKRKKSAADVCRHVETRGR